MFKSNRIRIVLLSLMLVGALSGLWLWASLTHFYFNHLAVPVALFLVKLGLSSGAAARWSLWLEEPLFFLVICLVLWPGVWFLMKRNPLPGATETLRFSMAVLPSRAVLPFRARTRATKPFVLWGWTIFVAAHTALLIYEARGTLSFLSALTMVFEWLAVFDVWKNALVSPLEIGVEGVRCGIRRLVRWEQIARAELWHSPFGKGHHLRFFDPRNRKIGFVAILHDGAEWNDALDCLRARAVSST